MKTADTIKKVREIIDDRKGADIALLDLKGLSTVTDYFVICTSTTERHSKTLAEHVVTGLKSEGIPPYHVEGLPEGSWVVIDYIDFIVHIFTEEMRALYALEKLWGDAKTIE